MNFDEAFEKLLGHEGGFSDNKLDPGGATNFGVTQAVARANGYLGDMRDFPIEQAKEIYKKLYWDSVKASTLPQDLRFHVFDAAVNSGVSQAIKWLQRAVNVNADGVMGPTTMHAIECTPGYVAAQKFSGHRLMFMTQLKTWPVFGTGWARRIANNLMET